MLSCPMPSPGPDCKATRPLGETKDQFLLGDEAAETEPQLVSSLSSESASPAQAILG